MRTTMDSSGRLVIPKVLRDLVGLRPGSVELEVLGAELRLRPVTGDELDEQDGFLVVPGSSTPLTAQQVRELRDADQR